MSKNGSGATTSPGPPPGLSGRGGHYIFIAKIFFTIISVFILLVGLPTVFAAHPDHYFGFNLVSAKISLVNMILITGTIQAVSRFIAAGKVSTGPFVRRTYGLQLLLCLTIGLIFFIIAPHITRNPNLVLPLRLAGLIPFFYGFYALNIGVLNGERRFRAQAFFDMLFAFLRLVLVVVGAWLVLQGPVHFDFLDGLVGVSPLAASYGGWAFLAFSFALFSWWWIRKDFLAPSATGFVYPYRAFTRFALAIIVFNFSFYTIVQMDFYTLEAFLDFAAVPENYQDYVTGFTPLMENRLREVLGWSPEKINQVFHQHLPWTTTIFTDFLNQYPALAAALPEKIALTPEQLVLPPEQLELKIVESYLGLYSISLRVAQLSFIFVTSVALVMFPNMSALSVAEDGGRALRETARQSLRFSMIILFFIGAGIFAAGPDLLRLLPGNYSVSHGPEFIRLLAFSQVLLALLNILLILVMGAGHAYLAALCSLLSGAVYLVANYILIGQFGAFGAVYGSYLALFTGLSLSGWLVFRKTGIRLPLVSGLRSLLAGILALLAAGLLPVNAPLAGLLLRSLVVVLVYFTVLALTREYGRADLSRLAAFLRGKQKES